jgi:putative membrane protein
MTTQGQKLPGETAQDQTNPVPKPGLMAKISACFSRILPSDAAERAPMDANQMAEVRTDLATRRTLMAADRTLMAWVRTALSMISFGFTIYKVLQGFQHGGGLGVKQQFDPETIGLFLIGLGTFSGVLGTIEYWHTLKELRQLQHFSIRRPAFVIALIMSVTGVSMFFSIITELI